MATRRRLGKTDIEVTPVGLGCWQFSAGQGLAGKFWEAIPQSVVDQVVEASLAGGINWFDTAEMYGNGASERALAAALRHAGKTNGEVVVATKWSPIFRTASSIRSTIEQRLSGLAPFAIDFYQVHNPLGFSSVEDEMRAMADLVEDKKVRAVGVSNFNVARWASIRARHASLIPSPVQSVGFAPCRFPWHTCPMDTDNMLVKAAGSALAKPACGSQAEPFCVAARPEPVRRGVVDEAGKLVRCEAEVYGSAIVAGTNDVR
jgi:hypothetical protein